MSRLGSSQLHDHTRADVVEPQLGSPAWASVYLAIEAPLLRVIRSLGFFPRLAGNGAGATAA